MMPTRLNTSILLILLAAYATWFLLYKTTIGYEIRAIGYTANIGMEAPRAQGINISRRVMQLMFISGALAALGGTFFILGLAGLFIGALRNGATSIQIANIPKTFSDLIEGMAVGFIALQVAVRYYLVKLIQRRRARRNPPADQEVAA
jgi:simple sugar transport system permease protein